MQRLALAGFSGMVIVSELISVRSKSRKVCAECCHNMFGQWSVLCYKWTVAQYQSYSLHANLKTKTVSNSSVLWHFSFHIWIKVLIECPHLQLPTMNSTVFQRLPFKRDSSHQHLFMFNLHQINQRHAQYQNSHQLLCNFYRFLH